MQFRKRFWEIDFLRGIAILMMIIFHFLYDLNYFSVYYSDLWSGFWFLFGRITALIFIFLVGISLTLSYVRTRHAKINLPLKYIKRGLRVFGYGLLITLATLLFLKDGLIIFGVLHFIGVAIILAYPFLRFSFVNLFLGIIFISIGFYISEIFVDFPWLLWLGLKQEYFYTLDYFPIFPWFGIVLFGLFFGNILYKNYERQFKLRDFSNFIFVKQLCLIGRHSLFIYFIHQPILIAILHLFVL
jgi:uncharacterized membrane protein